MPCDYLLEWDKHSAGLYKRFVLYGTTDVLQEAEERKRTGLHKDKNWNWEVQEWGNFLGDFLVSLGQHACLHLGLSLSPLYLGFLWLPIVQQGTLGNHHYLLIPRNSGSRSSSLIQLAMVIKFRAP